MKLIRSPRIFSSLKQNNITASPFTGSKPFFLAVANHKSTKRIFQFPIDMVDFSQDNYFGTSKLCKINFDKIKEERI